MPYASNQQRKFFHSAGAKKAGISSKTVSEFDKASKGMKMPDCLQCKNHVTHAHSMPNRMKGY